METDLLAAKHTLIWRVNYTVHWSPEKHRVSHPNLSVSGTVLKMPAGTGLPGKRLVVTSV